MRLAARSCPGQAGATVVRLLADPTRVPQWAPGFGDRVAGDARSGWQAIKDGRDFALRVVIDQAAGTVDYLREVAPGQEGGAYVMAVSPPRGTSIIVMTIPLLPNVDPPNTAATLTRELRATVSLVEAN
jgi:hypothetical protein